MASDAVDIAANKLMEHFDSCRIFVTKHDNQTDLTHCYSVGRGNFCAQRGQVDEWIERQNQYVRNDASAEEE